MTFAQLMQELRSVPINGAGDWAELRREQVQSLPTDRGDEIRAILAGLAKLGLQISISVRS